jgi:hypothetical protein
MAPSNKEDGLEVEPTEEAIANQTHPPESSMDYPRMTRLRKLKIRQRKICGMHF